MTFLHSANLSKEEFSALYDEHFTYLFRFILARVAGNRQVAEDILQETFLAVLKKPTFKGKSQFRTWLTTIARNKIIDQYRREFREHDWLESESTQSTTSTQSAEDAFSLVEDREIILFTLERLNPVYRCCLTMKYVDGYSLKEIASVLGRTPKAIDSVLQRARVAFEKEYIYISKGGTHDEQFTQTK